MVSIIITNYNYMKNIKENKINKYIPIFYLVVMGFISFTFHQVGDYGVETDFYWSYTSLTIDEYRPIGYQVVLAVVKFITQEDYFHAGQLINLISATLILFLISKMMKERMALFIMLFLMTNVWFLKYTYSCGTDMLFFLFWLTTIYYFLKNRLFLCGIFMGLSCLTRYTGLSLLIIPLILLFERKTIKRNKKSEKH